MKVSSVIMTHFQNPFTIFGVPPKLLIVLLAVTLPLLLVTFVVFGGLIAFVIFTVWSVVLILQMRKFFRGDKHAHLLLLDALRFWRLKKHRYFSAGQ